MGKLNINNGGIDTNKVMPDIDERFGPYASIEAANTALGASGRNCITAGLTVGITQGDGSVKEYWYQPDDGSSLTLVPKQGLSGTPVAGDFASFDANGNIVDSGHKHSDYATASQGEKADIAYQKPSEGIPATDLASAVQTSLGKADTAVQEVTVGTTTTGAAGTNGSVVNGGTATNPVLNFTIPRGADGQDGADAVNPFKGWYDAVITGEAGSKVITSETQNLPANPIVGDYAYVKTLDISGTAPEQVETPIAKIYECATAGTWSDSGMIADTSNVQTFASGEEVNETSIDDTNLANPTVGSLAVATDIVPTIDSRIKKHERGELDINGVSFTRQQINTRDGTINSSTTRLLSNLIPFSKDLLKITVADGYRVHSVCLYDGETFKGGIASARQSIVLSNFDTDNITHFRFVVRKSDSSATITLSDPYNLQMFNEKGITSSDEFLSTIFTAYKVENKYCDNSGWHNNSGSYCWMLPTSEKKKLYFYASNQTGYVYFLNTDDTDTYNLLDYATITKNTAKDVDIPDGTKYMVIGGTYTTSTDHAPINVLLYIHNVEEEKSGGVDLFESYPTFNPDDCYIHKYYINNNAWTRGDNASCYLIPVTAGDVFWLKARSSSYNSYYALIASDGITSSFVIDGEAVSYAEGSSVVTYTDANNWREIVIPQGCHYLYINRTTTSSILHDCFIVKKLDFAGRGELLDGTFNSSYSEIDTKDAREKFGKFITNLNSQGEDSGISKLETFLFFTDPHLTSHDRYSVMTDFRRNAYISALQKYYNSLPIDYCICGGDWLNSEQDTEEACESLGYIDAYMRKLFRNYLPVLGNHDLNPYSNGIHTSESGNAWNLALSQNTLRNLMFRENKETYYSYEAVNTTFYVLDNGVSFITDMGTSERAQNYPRFVANRWEQIDWFATKLINDDAEHSILISHMYCNATSAANWFSTTHQLSTNARDIAVAYNNRQTITKNGITYNFSQCTGRVDLYLVGHTHFDYVDTSKELPVVCTRNLGQSSPSFDCCLVDYEHSVFKMLRIGNGYSRLVHYDTKNVQNGASLDLTTSFEETDTLTVTIHADNNVTAISASVSGNVLSVTGIAVGINGVFVTNEATKVSEYYLIKVN